MTITPSDTITLPRADYDGLQEELNDLRVKVADLRWLLKLQKQRTLEAHRLYQQTHGWPDNQYPDLGELIGWLVAERTRLLSSYDIFEQLAPPDMPRNVFAKICFDCWDNEQSGDLREALRLAVAWSEFTDEQLDEIERTAGISLAELAVGSAPKTDEAQSA